VFIDVEENKIIRTHTAKAFLLNNNRSRYGSRCQGELGASLEWALWRNIHWQILPFCILGSMPTRNEYQIWDEFKPLLNPNNVPGVQMRQVAITIMPILEESESVCIMPNPPVQRFPSGYFLKD
jgi:hypothetical protein